MALFIFDFDGVFRNISWQMLYEAYVAIARHIGSNPESFWNDVDTFKQWHDPDWRVNLEKMGIPRGANRPEINDIFHQIVDPQAQIFPWVGDVIEKLASQHKLAILSNSMTASIENSLGKLTKNFSLIIGCDKAGENKPNVGGARFILRELGFSSLDSLMVGDTLADIKVGIQLCLMAVAVTWGLGTEDELERCKPDLILSDPYKLLKII